MNIFIGSLECSDRSGNVNRTSGSSLGVAAGLICPRRIGCLRIGRFSYG